MQAVWIGKVDPTIVAGVSQCHCRSTDTSHAGETKYCGTARSRDMRLSFWVTNPLLALLRVIFENCKVASLLADL